MRDLLSIMVLVVAAGAPVTGAGLPCPSGWKVHESGTVSARAEALRLDETIHAALQSIAATPGLAVGVVADGEVVYSRGFGVRDLETCDRVTPKSIFYLLSATKSFTGMAAAVLQEEGAFELDRSLSHYFPEVELEPPLNPSQTSVRDLLNHRPGLRNGAINFRTYLPGNLGPDEPLRVLADHSQPHPITFDYRNTSYVLAAQAIERETGLSWRELLEKRIFEPLGMSSTTTPIVRATDGEFAFPYRVGSDGGFESVRVKVQEQMHAAGGVSSNLEDLLRWVEANLEHGMVDGTQILPRRAVRQAHAPQIQYDWKFGRYRRFAYGLGVHNADLDGELVIHHFGGPIHVSFAPERGLGLVLLSAGPDSTGFVHTLAASLYDLLLGKSGAVDRMPEELAQARSRLDDRLSTRREREEEFLERKGALAREPSSYRGTYVSDRLGTVIVTAGGERFELAYGVLRLKLEPLEKDTFLVRFPALGPQVFVFDHWQSGRPAILDWDGRIFSREGDSGGERSAQTPD